MPAITPQQEARMAEARSTSRKFGQDRKHPFLINIEDGRLMPNVERLRKHRSGTYRVYTGDPKASLDERMAYIKSGVGPQRTRIVNSATEEPPFDIGTASKEDLVAFAAGDYGIVLDSNKPLKTLRDEFLKAVKALDGGAPPEDLS